MNKARILFYLNLINISVVIYFIAYFFKWKYLPYPFVYDKDNTFMDFYNPLWWELNGGFYEVWKSVYPPLNFYILKIVNYISGNLGYQNPLEYRDSNSIPIYIYLFTYLTIPLLIINSRQWVRIKTPYAKFLAYFLIITSAPLLFCLERGNIIIFSLVFLSLLINSKNNLNKAILIAILVNMKSYFAVYFFYFIVKRKHKYLFITGLLSLIIFAVFAMLSRDNPLLFFYNTFSFQKDFPITSPRELISFPVNFEYYTQIINTSNAANFLSMKFGGILVESLKENIYFINLIKNLFSVILIVSLFYFSKNISDEFLFLFLTILISQMGAFVGGYFLILYSCFIPLFLRMGRINKIYYLLFSLIFLNYDVLYLYIFSGDGQVSFLAGEYITHVNFELGISSILRPSANYFMLLLLFYHFIKHRYRESKYFK